jgi:hypothetical protein
MRVDLGAADGRREVGCPTGWTVPRIEQRTQVLRASKLSPHNGPSPISRGQNATSLGG